MSKWLGQQAKLKVKIKTLFSYYYSARRGEKGRCWLPNALFSSRNSTKQGSDECGQTGELSHCQEPQTKGLCLFMDLEGLREEEEEELGVEKYCVTMNKSASLRTPWRASDGGDRTKHENMHISMSGPLGPESLQLPSENVNALAVCCGEDSFAHELARQSLMVRPKKIIPRNFAWSQTPHSI